MGKTLIAAVTVLAATTAFASAPPAGDKAIEALKASPRHGEWVDVKLPDGKTSLHTWVSYPERADKAPVVLVIHEIFGMSDWVRSTTDALAAEGFIAVAPDLLSGKGPDGGNTDSFKGDDVRAAIQKLSPDEVTERLNAAKDYAIAQPSALPKFGVVGFCWGGGQSFNYAVRQPELSAAVVYYGTGPKTAEEVAKIHAPVLGNYGGDDARVTATVAPTKQLMADAKKSYEPIIHDKAGHGFLRQQDGKDGANAKAAEAAWTRTIAFFKEKLG
jgi:carboxymethylenebutenolidase